ncbi:hypothetical protein [Vibrio renipiscarius]|uniref:3-demethylubiquinone-9 3-methyltransferase n=1 Tax=Vibrio renipiscarius TaxID=1461322 RepID=A0A0C2NN03_9VIBR|nr:hypothetical protein [Vibrio renipiscarius]KII79495.1 3-demethylubiquinone-9 3-methyltransferase [Vibrio renipiscarius]KII80876.1 3-demethylubiquinone-9 3-methyltransferase [Vibrio renipiscarius]
MESILVQLRQEFYSHIRSLQAYAQPNSQPTLSVLTEDELKELEHAWIELSVWQRAQAH